MIRNFILFDYDGVLVDSIAFNLKAVGAAAQTLGYNEVPSAEYCRDAECISFERWARSVGMTEDHMEQFVSDVHQRVTAGASSLSIFDGISDLLERLSANNSLAVITGNVSAAARAFLDKHGVADHFTDILGADHPGSKSEKIDSLRRSADFLPHSTYYIGDAGTDIQHGRASGVRTVAVTWGYQGRERLSRENPDFIVESVDELAGVFCV